MAVNESRSVQWGVAASFEYTSKTLKMKASPVWVVKVAYRVQECISYCCSCCGSSSVVPNQYEGYEDTKGS